MLFGLAMLRENVKTAKVWCHNYSILLYSAAQLCTVKHPMMPVATTTASFWLYIV